MLCISEAVLLMCGSLAQVMLHNRPEPLRYLVTSRLGCGRCVQHAILVSLAPVCAGAQPCYSSIGMFRCLARSGTCEAGAKSESWAVSGEFESAALALR